MMNTIWGINLLVLIVLLMLPTDELFSQKRSQGLFDGNTDVGNVVRKGSVSFDSAKATYTIVGGGENMWYAVDAFHYVWRKASGDLAISAAISFVDTGGNAHRKAGLIIRQSLDSDAPYADAVVHGDGLTSMQYRDVKGGPTREIQANIKAPGRLKIQKQGEYVFMSVAPEGADFRAAGGSFRIKFTEPFYVGIGVCAHDSNALEKAVFSQVEIVGRSKADTGEASVESTVETVSIESKDRKAIYVAPNFIEGAFWSADGEQVFFSNMGQLYTVPKGGGKPSSFNTGILKNLGSSNGFSPDRKMLALSNYIGEHQSKIYVIPVNGGEPRLVTTSASSWWHGWSPDGATIVFAGMRDSKLDIYSIPVRGGMETRLTNQQGMNDGPEFSPDGRFIYFNSDRTGSNQIWRMKPDGSAQEQITNDGQNNWFPHVSPDGKWIAFLSYDHGVKGHPANQDVLLRVMPAAGGDIDVVAKLFGGQGTFDVNPWAPDSKNLTFISFRSLHK